MDPRLVNFLNFPVANHRRFSRGWPKSGPEHRIIYLLRTTLIMLNLKCILRFFVSKKIPPRGAPLHQGEGPNFRATKNVPPQEPVLATSDVTCQAFPTLVHHLLSLAHRKVASPSLWSLGWLNFHKFSLGWGTKLQKMEFEKITQK